ncbi:MAG: hypothetical protein KatS3mg003_1333 [Candidatus Nitrosocaldaceae archaeon]|nr:MAG: hypothetical protein KatS3mg003_1333 [Candidatus Nitrosocaldaceae archaeon]
MQFKNIVKIVGIAIIATLLASVTTIYAVNDEYGYHAIKPSATEIIGVKGQIYPYLSSTSDHVDRMIYMFSGAGVSPMFSIGVGHMDIGNNKVYYTTYYDEGVNDRVHWIRYSAAANGWYTAEVYTTSTSSDTYYFKVNNIAIGSYECISCEPLIIAGATSWGNNANNISGEFKDLQVKRNNIEGYKLFTVMGGLTKCDEEPNDIGFDYDTVNHSKIDLNNVTDDCTQDDPTYLYNNREWG